MYWYNATVEQRQLMASFCIGRSLLDLGGGDGSLSNWLISEGACNAVIVEKKESVIACKGEKLTWINAAFSDFAALMKNRQFEVGVLSWPEVGVLSWPVNNNSQVRDLICILGRCRFILYMGKNDAWTMCGTPTLWDYLTRREILRYMPARKNTLILYGSAARPAKQNLIEEELNGLNAYASDKAIAHSETFYVSDIV